MRELNYKHLHYFWAVARHGSISRAAEELHVTPQTISGQLTQFESVQGAVLLHKRGRTLVPTEMGRLVLGYAEEIFALGQELEEALQHRPTERSLQLRVGLSDALPKTLAYQLLEPALALQETVRIICREGKLTGLLAELVTHKLDVVLSDSPIPAALNVKGYNHLLGESGVGIFATPALRAHFPGAFPGCLNGAPFLLPGEDAALRSKLLHWFERHQVHVRTAGEFDDGALMAAFAQASAGFFAAPLHTAAALSRQYAVECVGQADALREQFYALSVQRKLTHPAVLAISAAAREQGGVR